MLEQACYGDTKTDTGMSVGGLGMGGTSGARLVKRPASIAPDSPFLAWFSDSKVRDSEGRPLVVFHGTDRDFDRFEAAAPRHADNGGGPVFYFTSNAETAAEYAESFSGFIPGENIKPVYLALLNPLVLDYVEEEGVMRVDYIGEALQTAKAGGFDSLIIHGLDEGQGLESQYIAFSPAQIKSAIGNCGRYDPNDACITR